VVLVDPAGHLQAKVEDLRPVDPAGLPGECAVVLLPNLSRQKKSVWFARGSIKAQSKATGICKSVQGPPSNGGPFYFSSDILKEPPSVSMMIDLLEA
jgi:hypothetical protein